MWAEPFAPRLDGRPRRGGQVSNHLASGESHKTSVENAVASRVSFLSLPPALLLQFATTPTLEGAELCRVKRVPRPTVTFTATVDHPALPLLLGHALSLLPIEEA